jgi:membrane protein required for colicin V production
MNSLDLFILIFASIFFIRGIFRGFVFELITVAGLIIGYLVAITYLHILSSLLISFFPALPIAVSHIISFIVIFIVTNVVLRFVANVLTRTLKFAMLGWLNRLLGGLFGSVKGILILSILVFLISFVPFSTQFIEMIGTDQSILFPLLKALGPELYEHIKDLGIGI